MRAEAVSFAGAEQLGDERSDEVAEGEDDQDATEVTGRGRAATGTGPDDDGWEVLSSPVIFKAVRLRLRRLLPAPAESTPAGAAGSSSSSSAAAPGTRPRHTPLHRSFCRVELGPSDERHGTCEPPSVVEFFMGETFGHPCARSADDDGAATHGSRSKSWKPPLDSRRIDVAPWVSEAALMLSIGEAADFEPVSAEPEAADGDAGAAVDSASGGLVGRRRLRVLACSRAADLLGDGSLMLRELEPGPGGQKPRDLARVKASWHVWFLKTAESVASWTVGTEFILDEASVLVAFELALKDMAEGSRACLRVAEEWGCGPLTPQGYAGPCLQGAAVWAEFTLHRVHNELAPGEHASVDEAVEFALAKKEQGNLAWANKTGADGSRALRRYEAGIRVLEALLPEKASLSRGGSKAPQDLPRPAGPLAPKDDLPRVEDVLTALRLNAAHGELRRQRWKPAAALCDAVLRRFPDNAKAHYRRGLARAELGEFSGAIEDLRAATAANPTDVGVRRELARVEALYKEHKVQERNTFGGVFEKMRQKDKEREEREDARKKAEAEREQQRKAQERERRRREEAEEAERQAKAKEKAGDGAPTQVSATCPPAEPAAPATAAIAAPAAPAPMGAPTPEALASTPTDAQGAVAAATSAAPGAEGGDPAAAPSLPPKPITTTAGTWAPFAEPSTNFSGQDAVDAKAEEILKELQKTRPGLRLMKDLPTVKESPPVEYEVPSFLRKKKKPPK